MTRIKVLVFAGCLACGGSAWAQEAPSVIPPVPRGSTDVPYPSGARGDATVVLELLVEKSGRVQRAEVIEGGPEPFAEQARRAALEWRFLPAQRAGTAVAARVRARVVFHEEPSETPVGPSAEAVAAPTGDPSRPSPLSAPRAAPQEIVVQGERREIGRTAISAAEVRQMPGAFGDAFRAIEALPGVTPVFTAIPYFFVRGAPPNDNGYFLDGVRLPLLFHVGLGPAVIHPGLLERVDFYPGAAPARWGGVAGAIVAGETRAPARRAHGEANARLFDAGLLLETPFAGDKASALIAGRYGYPGPLLGAISDTKVGYWDYQSRGSWQASERASFSLLAFGSHDYLAHKDLRGATVEDLVSDFHRLDLRYDYRWTGGRMRLGSTVGYDSQGANPSFLRDHSGALRMEIEHQLGSTIRVRGGADGRLDAYRLRQEAPVDPREVVPNAVDPPPTNASAGAYADLVWRVGSRVELVPGIRAGVFYSERARAADDATRVRTTAVGIDPRLSTRVLLAKAVEWLSTFGISHQYPTLRIGSLPALMAAGAGFAPGSSKLQTVLNVSQGVELHLPGEVVLSATAFLSRSWGLTDVTAICIEIEPPSAPPSSEPRHVCPGNAGVNGHAYGGELLVRRSLSQRLSGSLAYTLSRSVRESHFVTLDGGEAIATVPSDFDRTHVLNAVLAYDFGRGWRAGNRLVFYSGAPYSPLSGNVPVPPYNSKRDPPFFRLDVRLEKRWLLGPERSIAFVIEGQNVTLSRDTNTMGLNCTGDMTPDAYTTQCKRGKLPPLTIPSVGVEAIF